MTGNIFFISICGYNTGIISFAGDIYSGQADPGNFFQSYIYLKKERYNCQLENCCMRIMADGRKEKEI